MNSKANFNRRRCHVLNNEQMFPAPQLVRIQESCRHSLAVKPLLAPRPQHPKQEYPQYPQCFRGYRSESLQLLPAIEMLASLSTSPFPLAQRVLYMLLLQSQREKKRSCLCVNVCVCVPASTAFELDFGISWTVAVPDLQHPGNSIQF